MKTHEKLKYLIKIDTSERLHKKVALFDGDAFLAEKSGDIDIVVVIRDLLKERNLSFKDIVEFIPNLGPGSFTGLKMGVTVANVLNLIKGNNKRYLPEYGAAPNISKPKNR